MQLPVNHIILGDCLEILKTWPDNSVDFIFTDPPYGHNNNNNGDLISRREAALGKGDYDPERDNIPILNDGVEANEIFKQILPQFLRILKPGSCCCCCCCGGGPDPQFARWSLWMDEVFVFDQMVVWDKRRIGMGWRYRRSYEVILVGYKKGKKPKWYNKGHGVDNIIRDINRIIVPEKEKHPTEKPIRLPARFIKLHTQPGDIVLDPFCGRGSTLIAAKNNGRQFIGIELDPKWHRAATERLEQETEELPFYHKNDDEYQTDTLFRLDCGKTGGGL